MNTRHKNSDSEILRRLDWIEWALCRLLGKVDDIMANFSGWETELTGITDGVTAVEVLIQKIVDELKSGGADQAKIDGFVSQLASLKTRLATAAMAGTPAEEPPVA